MPSARRMALTPELVARFACYVEDSGPPPGTVYMSDGEYRDAVEKTLALAPRGDLWLFAYGSLLWKPACEVVDSRRATVRGWHRRFCLRITRFRGTPERPGLMMALDRGGRCDGMILRLAPPVQESVFNLFRRELMPKPPVNLPRWLAAETTDGTVQALGFVVNRHSDRYVGKLALEEIAQFLSQAAGHWGSCAQYLQETVARLEALGIHDRNLWRLQELVADRLTTQYQNGAGDNKRRAGEH